MSNMEDYVSVPVSVAKSIAETFQKSQVVILAYDPVHQVTHTTTYGKSPTDKENAAATGELVTKAIGNDLGKRTTFEDFHQDYDPAAFKFCVELMQKMVAQSDGSAYARSQMEIVLKMAGKQPRQG